MADITFLQSAIDDIEKARDWYDDKHIGLGESFLREIVNAVEIIKSSPQSVSQKIWTTKSKNFIQISILHFLQSGIRSFNTNTLLSSLQAEYSIDNRTPIIY